jgi:hypothetical protein
VSDGRELNVSTSKIGFIIFREKAGHFEQGEGGYRSRDKKKQAEKKVQHE